MEESPQKITKLLTLKMLYRLRVRQMLRDKGIYITESTFQRIIREKHKEVEALILEGFDYEFPYNLGKLGLRKFKLEPSMRDDKLVNLPPIDWKRTKELNMTVYSNIYTVYKVLHLKKNANPIVKFKWKFTYNTTIRKKIYYLATTNPKFDALEYVCTD